MRQEHLLQRELGLLLAVVCVLVSPPVRGSEDALDVAIRARIAAAGLKQASIGVAVVDVKSGGVLCNVDGAKLLAPASNVKLITTGVALLLLGGDFEFTTELYATRKREEAGVISGDLLVVAGGDPALSGRDHGGKTTAVFDALARQVALKVRVVTGDLVIDDTIFDRQYLHPSWPKDQLVRWYCAPVSAFALNDNCIGVSVRPGARVGDPARVILDPPTQYFRIDNRCRTIAKGPSRAVIHRLPQSDTLVISGTLTPKSAGASSPVTVHDPTRFAATVLRERLAEAGVRIDGGIVLAAKHRDLRGMERLAFARHLLAAAVRTANKRSQNFYAEMILKTLGRGVGRPASFAHGVDVVTTYLGLVGFPRGSFQLEDGSGLSQGNAFSALQLARFLRHVAQSKEAATFVGSLSVSGSDGTLRRRLARAPYAGRIAAKTGHLRGVSALSGYVVEGRSATPRLAFSILVNRAPAAAADGLQDSICQLLVDSRQ